MPVWSSSIVSYNTQYHQHNTDTDTNTKIHPQLLHNNIIHAVGSPLKITNGERGEKDSGQNLDRNFNPNFNTNTENMITENTEEDEEMAWAMPLLEKVLDMYISLFGSDHPKVGVEKIPLTSIDLH